MSYDLIDIRRELKEYNVGRVILSPNQWKQYKQIVDLSWKCVRFDKKNSKCVPNKQSGVYTFVIKPDIANHPACSYLMYVGKTEKQSLRKRFLQYFREKTSKKGRPKIKAMLTLWSDYIWFCYAPINDKNEISSVEKELINAYLPPMNEEFSGEIKQAIGAW